MKRMLWGAVLSFLFLAGCTGGYGDYGFRDDPFHNDFDTTWSMLEQHTSRSSQRSELYLSPNTELTIKKTRPVRVRVQPKYVYYDRRLKRYVAVDDDGRRYVLDGSYNPDRYVMEEETVLRARSGNQPSTIRYNDSKSTVKTGSGVIIKKRK